MASKMRERMKKIHDQQKKLMGDKINKESEDMDIHRMMSITEKILEKPFEEDGMDINQTMSDLIIEHEYEDNSSEFK